LKGSYPVKNITVLWIMTPCSLVYSYLGYICNYTNITADGLFVSSAGRTSNVSCTRNFTNICRQVRSSGKASV